MPTDLLKTALLGTERYPLSPELRQQALAYGLATLQEDAALLLGLAAIQDRLTRGAGLPLPYPTPAPSPILPDAHLRLCNSRAAYYLRELTPVAHKSKSDFLSQQIIDVLRKHSAQLPYELLPVWLDKMATLPTAWRNFYAIIGKRGAWLASLNAAWQYAATDILDTDWQLGSRAERLHLFYIVRHRAPDLAFAWLQQTWDSESADTKLAFLKLLAIHLHHRPTAAPEAYDLEIAFINAQLNSSRKDIRAQATLLLAPPPPQSAKMPADILINWVQNSYTLTSDSPFFSYLQTTPDVVLDARTTDALLIQLPLWTTNISHFSAKPLEILLQILATQTAEPIAALQALHRYDWQIDGRFGSLYTHLDQTKKILRWRSELTKELAH